MATHEDRTAALIFALVQLQGKLGMAGEKLVAPIGLTSARWQVLGTIIAAPMTMADIARAVGNARQSVRRLVGELETDGLVRFQANPRNKRVPLVEITDQGRSLYEAADRLRIPWNRNLASKLEEADVVITKRVIDKLAKILEV